MAAPYDSTWKSCLLISGYDPWDRVRLCSTIYLSFYFLVGIPLAVWASVEKDIVVLVGVGAGFGVFFPAVGKFFDQMLRHCPKYSNNSGNNRRDDDADAKDNGDRRLRQHLLVDVPGDGNGDGNVNVNGAPPAPAPPIAASVHAREKVERELQLVEDLRKFILVTGGLVIQLYGRRIWNHAAIKAEVQRLVKHWHTELALDSSAMMLVPWTLEVNSVPSFFGLYKELQSSLKKTAELELHENIIISTLQTRDNEIVRIIEEIHKKMMEDPNFFNTLKDILDDVAQQSKNATN